jgi:phage shock protein A
MKLLERVSMLIRANLNDLIDKSEDPEKMVKQVILDLHNQYIQVKTQLAVALTEQHMIEDKATETRGKASEWLRKAELAVDRGEDGLAKRALERHNTSAQSAELFAEQAEEHKKDVELLRTTLVKLEDKLREAEAKKTVMLTQHRAARARARAGKAVFEATGTAPASTLGRMEDRIREEGARGSALFELAEDDLDATFARMERAEQLERQLSDLKARRAAAKQSA